MAEGRCREHWNHTSAILAMLANVNRDPKKSRVFKPDDFNPYVGTKAVRLNKKDAFKLLKNWFVNPQRKETVR